MMTRCQCGKMASTNHPCKVCGSFRPMLHCHDQTHVSHWRGGNPGWTARLEDGTEVPCVIDGASRPNATAHIHPHEIGHDETPMHDWWIPETWMVAVPRRNKVERKAYRTKVLAMIPWVKHDPDFTGQCEYRLWSPNRRCKRRATWHFKALKRSHAKDGSFCLTHLDTMLFYGDQDEKMRFDYWWRNWGKAKAEKLDQPAG